MIKILHVYPKNEPLTARYVHLLMDKIESKATDNAAEFKAICQEWQPDIIHQHGSVDIKWQGDYRWVISPNGLQSPFTSYYAVIARSPLEAEHLREAGVLRVETVMNPLITKQVDFTTTAEQLMRIYRKVMNSDPLDLMDDDTREALPVILKAGICGDKRWVEQKLPIPSVQTRLLYIYASLEGILPLLKEGMRVLEMGELNDEAFECYLPQNYTIPSTMKGSSILRLTEDIQKYGISMCRLVDIYKALMDENHDDNKLNEILKENEATALFSSILQLISEVLLLDEGYMPCPPVDNAETRKLRLNLQNRLRL